MMNASARMKGGLLGYSSFQAGVYDPSTIFTISFQSKFAHGSLSVLVALEKEEETQGRMSAETVNDAEMELKPFQEIIIEGFRIF